MINILILFICVSALSCKAQTIISNENFRNVNLPNNAYIKDINNNHDAVIGTWLWQDGNGSSFQLVIEEREMSPDPVPGSTIFWDQLYGKYKYIENYITKVDVLSQTYIEPYQAPFSMTLYTPNEYLLGIKDLSSNKGFKGKFILTSPTTATIELRMNEGLKIREPGQPDLPFSIPTLMVLMKQ